MRVVVIENVRAHGVHRRRQKHVAPFTPSDYSGILRAAKSFQGGDVLINRRFAAARDRARDVIQQRAFGFMPDAFGNIPPREVSRKGRKAPRRRPGDLRWIECGNRFHSKLFDER